MNNPPPSNLGPQSEPWARDITEQVRQNAEAIERLGGDASNDGRVNNSQMDQIAYQINELQQRQSGTVLAPGVTTPTFSTGSQTVNITIQIPRPDVARVGWVSVQFTATNSNTNQSEIYASMSMDGRVFHRDSRAVPTQNLEPASWNGAKPLQGYTGFTAGPGAGGTITLTLEASAALSTGARFVDYTDIRATYQYSQPA